MAANESRSGRGDRRSGGGGPRYPAILREFMDRLGGPEKVMEDFLARLDLKLAAGEKEYGDGSFANALRDTLDELEAETLDLAGWGLMAFARIGVMRKRLAILDDRDFPGEFIFVSGPFSHGGTASRKEREANALLATRAGQAILKKGHWPFVPHTMFPSGWECHLGLSYEAVIQACLAWVTTCDSLLTLGPSPGADRELARANLLDLRVYVAQDDIPEVPLRDGGWEGTVDHAKAKDDAPPDGGPAG